MRKNRSNFIHRTARHFLAVLALFCVFHEIPVFASASVADLISDTNPASAGFFRLSWKSQGAEVELQESTNADFEHSRLIYTGSDQAAVQSGKADGIWYYRIRALVGSGSGPWSEPIQVKVAHHPLHRAITFLSLGFLVFAATVWVVVRGMGKSP